MRSPALGASRLARVVALATAALVVTIGVLGYLQLRVQQRRFREQAEAQLSAIADLKVSQITAWREERIADASDFTDNRLTARALKPALLTARTLSGENDPRAWLESLASHHGYTSVVLADRAGRFVAVAGAAAPPSRAHVVRHLSDALREGRALLTDLEVDETTGAVHIDLIAPLYDPDRPTVALGGVLLRIDPAAVLYPLVQSWPTPIPSASAESALVRADGDAVLFLSELRHWKGAPLSLRLPLADRRHPAVQYALGGQGVTTGIDYRGIEVLAAGRAVPGTPWSVINKVDAREILAPGEEQAVRVGAIFLLVMCGIVGAMALWWRHRTALLERARFAEAQARQALARHLELLSEHANDVVLLVDDGGRIVRANDRVHELHGWSPAELVGLHIREMRAPGHGQDFEGHIARLRREGCLRYETVHRRRDGTTFPVEVSARGFEAEGRWFFQAIVQDVSGRKEALRVISYQAELLRSLHDGVIGLDADHLIREWNPAAERMYGLAAAEVIGKTVGEVLPSEYRGYSFAEFVHALDARDRFAYEVRRRLPDGGWVDVEASAVVLRGDDGRITGYVTVNRDVTVRKRAEAALRASQERLARILETSSEGIWIVDAQGRTEFVNDRAAKLFGTTPAEALGRPHLDFVPEHGRANALEAQQAMLQGETVKREFVMRRPDRSDVWINLSWTALHDGEGRVAGGVALFVDVTEHRRAREQLLHAHKMEAVGRLASGVAHDFNNLLVSILSCSGYLLEKLPAGDPLREEAAEIKSGGERGARIVRELLAFGRKSALRPVEVELDAVVRHIESLLRRAAGERVALTVSLGASWPTRIDPGQLEQVLMNLVVNARDAMPGGGQLRIGTSDETVLRSPADRERPAAGRYAVLTVTDTGSGIQGEVLPKIFEPFFTTKEEGRGTGLGLSTVYGIVEEAGGTVAVTTSVGRGTTFAVYLPACAPVQQHEDRGAIHGQDPVDRQRHAAAGPAQARAQQGR